jgi:hypothetical protein
MVPSAPSPAEVEGEDGTATTVPGVAGVLRAVTVSETATAPAL